MTIRIGINGFGRIGRAVFRNSQFKKNIKIVAINDLVKIDNIAYMLKYDSIHGKFNGTINIVDNNLFVNDNKIYVTSFSKPNDIPWSKFNVDVVIESTGIFLTKELSYGHILSGSKYVVITNSSKKNDIPMFVMGINHHNYNGQNIVSNSSCTTNCLAPIIKVINDNFGIIEVFITNIHASTSIQKIVDSYSLKNLRIGRSIFGNIIPYSTSSIDSLEYIIPDLKNKIKGMSFRVPVPNVSVIDFTIKLNSDTTYNEICSCMEEASKSYLNGILGITYDDVVSSDFNGNKLISIFDAKSTLLLNNKFIKLISWYDNETGYSEKVLDLASYIYYYN